MTSLHAHLINFRTCENGNIKSFPSALMHLNVFLVPVSIKQDKEKIIQETNLSHRPLNCKGPCQPLTIIYYRITNERWCLTFDVTLHGMCPCLLISQKVVINYKETINSPSAALNLNRAELK